MCQGPPKTALDGPVLSSVPYPGVLVAKAWSHTSSDLDLVLFPSDQNGSFEIGVEKLRPKGQYQIGPEIVTADDKGCVRFTSEVKGRTQIKIIPVE